ncbi:MAG: TonB-dependent receptor, partial [Phenylobacterium sp.]
DLESLQTNSDGAIGCATAKQRQASGAWTAIGIPAASQGTILTNMCLTFFNNGFNQRLDHQSSEETEWTGTIKAAYRWTPQVMTYASYARGYKGGGFNLDRTQSSNGQQSGGPGLAPIHDTSFPAEFVDSYELGMKNTLLDRTLLLNATLFHQTFSDFQLNAFLGTSFQVRPIPEVTSKGVDMDLLWFTPLDGLTLQGGLTYADTRYGDDKVPNDATNGNALLPGSQLSYAPKWSGSASVGYERDVADSLLVRFNVGAKYMSEYSTGSDLLPMKLQKAYTLVNARIGFGDRDERWMVELWANNLFDKDYFQVAFNGPLQGSSGLSAANATYDPARDTITYDAIYGAPRTIGATLRARF